MDEKILKLLADLHVGNKCQGPGSDEVVRRILNILGLDKNSSLEIADIGCGTGASTIELLKSTNSNVTAIDFLPIFLEKLKNDADKLGFLDRVQLVEADMANLPFEEGQFDVVWSEGAIYNIGFEKGVKEWSRLLKSGGYMVLSEITWIQDEVPDEIKKYWEAEYPEVDFAENKIKVLEEYNFKMIDYFVLPENCWLDEYYYPLENTFDSFLERNSNGREAKQIVEENKAEINLYKKYKDYYSYGVYIAQKI